MNTPRQNTNPQVDATSRIPLLALHGFTGCGADFQWLAKQTNDLFDWHTLDFAGHGDHRDAPPAAHTPAATARVIANRLSTLAKPVSANATNTPNHTAQPRQRQKHELPATPPLPILLGYSMGGRMALRTLAQYGTANVRGLILIGASAGLADSPERRNRRQADHSLARRIETEGLEAFMAHWNSLPLIASQSRSPYFAQLQALRHANSALGLARSLHGIGTGAVAPVHSRLHRIDIPCLLLSGEHDAKFTAIASQMATALPQAQHVSIPQAGHSPHWENPQATELAIRNWAKKTPAPRQ